MVLDYYGVPVSEQEVVSLTNTTITGTRLEEATAVASLGVEVTVERATLTELRQQINAGRPCIVSVLSVHFAHYALLPFVLHAVVVAGIDNENVYVFDPARESAPDTIPLDSFEAAWQGGRNRMIVVSRKED
jgi:ABC-type bacteriocin/lantibiotic exporter with double-glycine peptidase domain